jgi:hypothetical protein
LQRAKATDPKSGTSTPRKLFRYELNELRE